MAKSNRPFWPDDAEALASLELVHRELWSAIDALQILTSELRIDGNVRWRLIRMRDRLSGAAAHIRSLADEIKARE